MGNLSTNNSVYLNLVGHGISIPLILDLSFEVDRLCPSNYQKVLRLSVFNYKIYIIIFIKLNTLIMLNSIVFFPKHTNFNYFPIFYLIFVGGRAPMAIIVWKEEGVKTRINRYRISINSTKGYEIRNNLFLALSFSKTRNFKY